MIRSSLTPRRHRSTLTGAAIIAVLPLLGSVAARADDVNIGGGSRVFGMAGAGLALPYGGGPRINPASLAFERSPTSLAVPSVGILSGGLSQSDVRTVVQNGDASAAASLLRQFASSDRTIGLNTDVSLRISKLEISSYGIVRGYLQPNGTLSTWLKAGNTGGSVPEGSRADLIAGGYYTLPAVAFGTVVPMQSATGYIYGAGIRVKKMKGVFTHYTADSGILNSSGGSAFAAPEMNGSNLLTKTGVGADVGLYIQPQGGQGVGVAFTINNIVNPGLTFAGTDRNGNATNYKLLGTTLNAGIGYQRKATSLAADLVDIAGATEKAEIRLGAEQKIFNTLAVRAGFSSHTGYTAGVGIWGLGIAVGKHLPLEVAQSLRF